MSALRLSVLDQVPATEHVPFQDAPASSLQLAQEVEELGYRRIWFAEHHRSPTFASAAPEMIAALALERTQRIRVGTGGILLPLYPSWKVDEAMGLLNTVHGDRVDTGVGRAAFDDPEYGAKIAALVRELEDQVWVLGAGGSTAPLAGQLGAGYVHGHFFVPKGGEQAMSAYRSAAADAGSSASTMLAVRAVTAGDPEYAQALGDAMVLWRVRKDLGDEIPVPSVETVRNHVWTDKERTRAEMRRRAIITGTPDEVHHRLTVLAETHGTGEIMVNTLVSDPADRIASYRLLAEQFS